MDIESLWENEPKNYFEHCYMVEQCKKDIKSIFTEEILEKYPKRVFINLGAQQYNTSTSWFINNYPGMKTLDWDIHIFECDDTKISGYKNKSNIKVHNCAVWDTDGFHKMENRGIMGRLIDEEGQAIKNQNKKKVNIIKTIDFMKWLKTNFNKEDFIVIKCDIEGSEFKILPSMIENSEYINELFIEFHYNRWMNPGRTKHAWIKAGKPRHFNIPHNKFRHPQFKHTFSYCINYMKKLRNAGIHAHWWP